MEKVKLNYDDITIVPEVVTNISSRSECNPYDKDGYLPIFASCMSSVVSIENTKDFNEARIKCVIPRSYSLNTRIEYLRNNISKPNFVAFSLSEAEKLFAEEAIFRHEGVLKICIDLANGHMKKLLDLIKRIKSIYGDKILIMAGNIANPETYRYYEEAGCDYVRCSIGTGNVCFVAGTKITMADETLENIEDINVGDYVKTINGNQKVINTFIKNTDETVIINNEIECTPNHKFFVLRKSDFKENITDKEIKEKGIWIEAVNLNEDFLLIQD